MLFGGMIAIYIAFRDAAGGSTAKWLPKGVEVPDVAVHMMLVTMIGCSMMAQWAVYAITRNNRRDTAVALGVLALFGVAVLNAQIFVYNAMGLDIRASGYAELVYAITATFLVALIAGIAFAVLMAFRELGGRYSGKEHDGISSLALYWHFLTVAFVAVWFVIYTVE